MLFAVSLSVVRPLRSESLSGGTAGLEEVWGSDLRTLRTPLVNLRYDVSLEPMARRILPRLQSYLATLQKDLRFRLRRPLDLYLVARGFGNAFVMPAISSSSSFSLIPSSLPAAELGADVFVYAGTEEDFFTVFTHEVMHYIEFDQRMAPWRTLFGDAPYATPYPTGWMTEAWAVNHESRGRSNLGRMQESYFGALLRAGVSARASKEPTEWDLSRNNPEWVPVGAHYVVGSNFYYFLKERYGQRKLDKFVIHENSGGLSSAYTDVFGRSFAELWSDFQAETRRKTEAVESAAVTAQRPGASDRIVFDDALDTIGALGTTSGGETVFIGTSISRMNEVYRLGADGSVRDHHGFFEWWSPWRGPLSSAPLDWSAGSGDSALYYFAAQSNADGNSSIPGLYLYDFEQQTRRRVLELPRARSAVVAADAETYFVLRQPDLNVTIFTLEKGRLQSSNSVLEVLGRWNEFSSVAHLRLSHDGRTLIFSAIKKGGSWGVYSVRPEAGQTPRLLIDTPGQDLFPVSTAQGLYFLSDLDGRSFQVYRLTNACLSQITREPFFVRSFVVKPGGHVWAISRRGQRERLVEVAESEASDCLANVPHPVIVAEESPAPTTAEPEQESAWSALVPATRTLQPRYDSDAGWGGQALLAGESPYKDWGWALLGNVDFRRTEDHAFALALGFRQNFPCLLNVHVENSRLAAGSAYVDDGRFLTTSADFSRSFNNHNFSFRLIHSADVSPQDYGSAFGFSAAHAFSNARRSWLSADAQEGWGVNTAVVTYPEYFGSTATRTLFRGTQHFYLPLLNGIFPTHSLEIEFAEVKGIGSKVALTGSDNTSRRPFHFSSALAQSYGIPSYVYPLVTVRGYSDQFLKGDLALGAHLTYTIPLNFLRSGVSTLAGRRWLNPETTAFLLSLFFDQGYLSGSSAAEAGSGSQSLASTGVQLHWQLWENENHQTGTRATYVFAKELNLDRKVEHTLLLESFLTF